jgi:hypothetical protein
MNIKRQVLDESGIQAYVSSVLAYRYDKFNDCLRWSEKNKKDLPCDKRCHPAQPMSHLVRKPRTSKDPESGRDNMLEYNQQRDFERIWRGVALPAERKLAKSTGTEKPSLASFIAPSKSLAQGNLPWRWCNNSHPRSSPGTPTARPPTVDAYGAVELIYIYMLLAAGAVSLKSI